VEPIEGRRRDEVERHYELKLYLLADTPENRRFIGKYLEIFQHPDGRIEIRVAGQSLPYSVYDKLGSVDQGAIVENKRLEHMLQVAQMVQSKRDSRAVDRTSTAHRAGGTPVPRSRVVDSKSQRELGEEDLEKAMTTYMDEISAGKDGGQSGHFYLAQSWTSELSQGIHGRLSAQSCQLRRLDQDLSVLAHRPDCASRAIVTTSTTRE